MFEIDGIKIGLSEPAYVIAEVGNNHQGSLSLCKELIVAAKNAGASAVKLQTRHNRTLLHPSLYKTLYTGYNSFGDTYGDHREALELKSDDLEKLIEFSQHIGITLFSTPFDIDSAYLCTKLGMKAIKVASAHIDDLYFLKKLSKFNLPMIVSTGGATISTMKKAFTVLKPLHNKTCFLHCVATYPTSTEDLNLRVISTLRKQFPDIIIGLSDHSPSIYTGPIAYTLGARVFEKHFTLDKTFKGNDHSFSLTPEELKEFIANLEFARLSLGISEKVVTSKEKNDLNKMRKTVFARRDLKSGTILQESDICMMVEPNACKYIYFMDVLNKRLKIDLHRNDAVFPGYLE